MTGNRVSTASESRFPLHRTQGVIRAGLFIISTGICNIVANLVLFVPIGCLLPRVFHKQNFTLGKIFLIGIGFSLIVETTQLVTHRGYFDLDDLFHNSIGTVLGYALGKRVFLCTSNSETDS